MFHKRLNYQFTILALVVSSISLGCAQTNDAPMALDSESSDDADGFQDTAAQDRRDSETDTEQEEIMESDSKGHEDSDSELDPSTDLDSAEEEDTATAPEDLDSDGWFSEFDCDDENADAHPDMNEIYDPPNGVDDDCDGLTDEDEGDGDTDTGEDKDTDTADNLEYPPYLLHFKKDSSQLSYISIETGAVTDLCEVRDIDSGQLLGTGGLNFNLASLTFNREDRLLGSTGGQLWEIHLPSCEAEFLGKIGPGAGEVFGICPAESGNGLLGISASSDVLIRINEDNGSATIIGDLGVDWFMHGATWSDDDNAMYGIRGINNSLYELSYLTGASTLITSIDVRFANVGMEYHPQNGNIYACTNDGNLYLVHLDGTTEVVGVTGLSWCSNLGAPHGNPPLPDVI